jgi:hypothetical protein
MPSQLLGAISSTSASSRLSPLCRVGELESSAERALLSLVVPRTM